MLWSPARLTGGRQRHRKDDPKTMTGAMYAAIGGLKTHMSNLNVIGNNIANVNTYGYKAGRMTFKESMYTTSRTGSNGGITSGGNNPSQIGYGCSIGSIDLNMSPSTYAPTGYPLDTYIDGEGFYMFGDKDGNILDASDVSELELSRVGDFWIDPDGYICNRDGKCLYGFARVQNPQYDPNAPKDPTDKDYNANKVSPTIVSSQLVPLRVPLSAAAPTEENGGIVNGTKQWEEGDPVYPWLKAENVGGKNYLLNQYASTSEKAIEIGGGNNNNPGGGNTTTGPIGADGSTMVPAPNTDPLTMETIKEIHVQLKEVSVQKNGAIQGIAANGDTVIIGYIAIANCDSPDGVTHIDGPYYKAMGGAGKVRVSALNGVLEGKYLTNQIATEGANGAAGTTPDPADAILNEKAVELRSSGLESSSTDIAQEFTDMIKTQRGYQANTRIITVTDSMLEELVNMKR